MSDDNKDLVRLASEYADKNVDFYDLLGIDALTSKDDIRRAWRKKSLNYHPDKAGENYDASKWEMFEHARDILMDENARAVYDQSLKAKLLRKQERDAMNKERKKFADDLEAAENAAMVQKEAREQKERELLQQERERLSEAQRMREEEEKRQTEAAQEMEDMAEARRRMKERKEEKARRKQAKDSMRRADVIGKASDPINGAVPVPGDYLADLGDGKKLYWELVCDKLRAVQAVRNLQKQGVASEELQEAEMEVQEARRRIYEAEAKFQQEPVTV